MASPSPSSASSGAGNAAAAVGTVSNTPVSAGDISSVALQAMAKSALAKAPPNTPGKVTAKVTRTEVSFRMGEGTLLVRTDHFDDGTKKDVYVTK